MEVEADMVEQARDLFRKLEDENPFEASEVARRAFHIYGLLSDTG